MMLASSLWLATLLSVHLGEAVSQIVMLVLIAVALALFALKGQKSSPLFWLVVIALSAFGGYQARGCLTRRLTLRHKCCADHPVAAAQRGGHPAGAGAGEAGVCGYLGGLVRDLQS
jgi:thiol:disulfide interchange protein